MGDHFDWGAAADAERAAADGVALFSWLAAHAPDHVTMIAGNHDLGRVGELAFFDDATFRDVRTKARAAYDEKDPSKSRAMEVELVQEHPALPSAELAARDFAAFCVKQRELVASAIDAGRLVAARAWNDHVLLLHAGITDRELDVLGLVGEERQSAQSIAAALNAALHDARIGRPLTMPGLHEPGSSAHGEGGGMFYHRPTSRRVPDGNRRRFDPRTMPKGLTQVVGHIGDEKCRELMPAWSSGDTLDGVVRTLSLDDSEPIYRIGIHQGSTRVIFTDGGMNRTPSSRYQLLDLTNLI